MARKVGTALGEELYGDSGPDELLGMGGDDKLYGNDGDNLLDGGDGADQLFGGNNADRMLGGAGNDLLYGNEGADVLVGGAGSDKLYGAGGADVIYGDAESTVSAPSSGVQTVTTAASAASTLRSMNFIIAGEPGVMVTVAETATGALAFELVVTDTVTSTADKVDVGDLRGLFFHVSAEGLLNPSKFTINGADVTSRQVAANAVIDLGNAANMQGRDHAPFDIGVEFGTAGVGKDDIRNTSFTLSHADQPLKLELVAQQWFGARLTSVSENGVGRDQSLKLVSQAPAAPAVPTTPTPPTNPTTPSTGGDDLIEAGAGNDRIYGGAGDDEMQGEGGDDLIVGGTDNGKLGAVISIGDNLYGNDGRDTFIFAKGDGVDMIWDFQPGIDHIEISGYSAGSINSVILVGGVANRIATGAHQKIAVILDGGSDAIIFNDFPNPQAGDAAIRFADGTVLSSADLVQRAQSGSVTSAVAATVLRSANALAANDIGASASLDTDLATVEAIIDAADATTSVATLSYQFFTGKTPAAGGLDYLVSPTGPNGNNLNSAYFQSFNLENRYINFAVNLGRDGEGKDKFAAGYGNLSLIDATKKAYKEIFGSTPNDKKAHDLIDGREAYFYSYGKTDLGAKAAMVGWLLAEAEKGDVGVYAKSNAAFLAHLIDGAEASVDLIGVYGKPDYVFGG
ncbi:hypothetical protein ABOZ73_10805 [Caulobacter sp. 73W]|uniref:Calcium-binding protein n=1 Tax=Caulobacter sp. 73W TaxID=3161137 RepID=A0AB39KP05_9CAUL